MIRRGSLFLGLWAAAAAIAVGPASAYQGVDAQYSVDQVAKILNSKSPPKTIEETLSRIQRQSPRLFENVILMYRSKSFQVSSAEFPRALVFNKDASFVMAFNGHPSQRGYDRLEMMQFDYVSKRFAFFEARSVAGKMTLSDPNPKLCLSCHQSPDRKTVDPRPNWEPYSRWPGAIGSEQNHFNPNSQPEVYRLEDAVHIAEAGREEEILKNFVSTQRGHERYKLLKLFGQKQDIFRTATTFTDLIGRLNFYRIERLARTDAPEHYESIKYLLGGVIRCGKLFLNEPVLSRVEQQTPDENDELVVRKEGMVRNRIKEARDEWLRDGAYNEAPVLIRVEPAKYPSLRVSEGLWLLFAPYGIDISDWSMDFRTNGRLAFQERFGLPTSPANAAYDAFEKMGNESVKLSCDELEKLAVAQGENLTSLPVKARPVEKPLLSSCVRCHAQFDNTDAPWIPFDNPSELKFALQRPVKNGRLLLEEIRFRLSDHANVDEQMPMGLSRPSEKSRRELMSYLEGLNTDLP